MLIFVNRLDIDTTMHCIRIQQPLRIQLLPYDQNNKKWIWLKQWQLLSWCFGAVNMRCFESSETKWPWEKFAIMIFLFCWCFANIIGRDNFLTAWIWKNDVQIQETLMQKVTNVMPLISSPNWFMNLLRIKHL